MTDVRKSSQRSIGAKDTGQSTKNLPGGTSAVVPPDPMPNSEVKRRSADGSVGSPHVRVGNCQASNKTESSVERLGFLRFRGLTIPPDNAMVSRQPTTIGQAFPRYIR